jgi:hypothetical protein
LTSTTNNVIDKGNTGNIRPATIVEYHNLGFKLVPLSFNHKPVMDWTHIYENPDYWSEEKLMAECYVATALGKTHVKGEGGAGDRYLNEFDCDSEFVYKKITTPIDEISNLRLKSRLQELCSKLIRDMTTEMSLLDCLKRASSR